jgi:hypothetical protein
VTSKLLTDLSTGFVEIYFGRKDQFSMLTIFC